MTLETNMVISLIALVISATLVVLNYMVYRRQRSLDNENHFFKYKIEQYQQILNAAAEMLDFYSDKNEEGGLLINNIQQNAGRLNEIADELDKKTTHYRNAIIRYSLFLPEQILNQLIILMDELYEEYANKDKTIRTSQDFYVKMVEVIDKYNQRLAEICNNMRTDIGIESLNLRLNKRVGKLS